MGMSASQARYLALVAQQSNLEYQGQQINQERSILSQQVSELYNSLLTMEVPTPPSTQEYTTIQYAGVNGATKYTFDASDVRPGKDGGYNVSLGYTDYGHSLSRNKGYSAVTRGYEEVQGRKFSAADTRSSTGEKSVNCIVVNESSPADAPQEGFFKPVAAPPSTGNYYVLTGNGLVLGGKGYVDNEQGPYYVFSTDANEYNPETCLTKDSETTINISIDIEPSVSITTENLDDLYVVDNNGVITKAEASKDYTISGDGTVSLVGDGEFFIAGVGTDKVKKGKEDGYKIAGRDAMTMAEYKNSFDEKNMDTYNGYLQAIANSGLVDGNGEPYTEDDFMVYLDEDGQPHFALTTDVKDNDTCVTYDYLSNGAFTKRENHEDAKLTFDPSSGRITSVDIPIKDANGEVISWTTINLQASEVTDENAYNDAYAAYEYAQYEYDREQQEINAKTEKIQAMDRNLELRLQRLDTQRTQITTELEAVKKVMKDNIEGSYKSFSG